MHLSPRDTTYCLQHALCQLQPRSCNDNAGSKLC